MKIRKVINHFVTGELSLPMVLAANFFSMEVWKSYGVVYFGILFNLKCEFWSCLHYIFKLLHYKFS